MKMVYVLIRTSHDAALANAGTPIASFTNEQEANQIEKAMNQYTWADMSSNMKLDKLAEYDRDIYGCGMDVCDVLYTIVPVPSL